MYPVANSAGELASVQLIKDIKKKDWHTTNKGN